MAGPSRINKEGNVYRCKVNVFGGVIEQRTLGTEGMHSVFDVFCFACGSFVGWKHVSTGEATQTDKDGKFILERVKVFGPCEVVPHPNPVPIPVRNPMQNPIPARNPDLNPIQMPMPNPTATGNTASLPNPIQIPNPSQNRIPFPYPILIPNPYPVFHSFPFGFPYPFPYPIPNPNQQAAETATIPEFE